MDGCFKRIVVLLWCRCVVVMSLYCRFGGDEGWPLCATVHIRYDAENTQNSLYISIKSQFKQRCAHVYFSHLTTIDQHPIDQHLINRFTVESEYLTYSGTVFVFLSVRDAYSSKLKWYRTKRSGGGKRGWRGHAPLAALCRGRHLEEFGNSASGKLVFALQNVFGGFVSRLQ